MRHELNLTSSRHCRNGQEADFGITHCLMIPSSVARNKKTSHLSLVHNCITSITLYYLGTSTPALSWIRGRDVEENRTESCTVVNMCLLEE